MPTISRTTSGLFAAKKAINVTKAGLFTTREVGRPQDDGLIASIGQFMEELSSTMFVQFGPKEGQALRIVPIVPL